MPDPKVMERVHHMLIKMSAYAPHEMMSPRFLIEFKGRVPSFCEARELRRARKYLLSGQSPKPMTLKELGEHCKKLPRKYTQIYRKYAVKKSLSDDTTPMKLELGATRTVTRSVADLLEIGKKLRGQTQVVDASGVDVIALLKKKFPGIEKLELFEDGTFSVTTHHHSIGACNDASRNCISN